MRKIALWFHRGLGVLASGLIILFGLTGMVLVLAAPNGTLPHTSATATNLPILPIQQIVRRLDAQTTTQTLRSIDLPATASEPYRARFKQVGKKTKGRPSEQDIYLSATTGEILATTNRATEPAWLKLVKDLHTKLLINKTGNILVGLVGIVLVVLSVSGTLLWSGWRKLKAGFKIRWQARWQMLNYDLHQVGSIAIVSALMLFAVTGTVLAWEKPLENLGLLPAPHKPEKVEILADREIALGDIEFDRAIAIADRSLPNGQLTRINLPDPKHGYLRIHKRLNGDWLHPNGKSWVDIEPISYNVLAVENSANLPWLAQLRSAFGPLHTGHFGGLLIKGIYSLSGLGAVAISVTGMLIWWNRTYTVKKTTRKTS